MFPIVALHLCFAALTRHGFPFGTALDTAIPSLDPQWQAWYKATVAGMFNAVVGG